MNISYFPITCYKNFFILSLTLFCSVLHSQDFEVAPVKLIFSCEQGQIASQNMSIKNHANQKQQFNVTISDIKQDSASIINKPDEKNPTNKSCKDWLTLSPTFFELNPNESKEVKVVMQVPPGHSETRWAMIYISVTEEQTSMAADKQMKAGLKIKARVGVKVIQSPKSNTNFNATITDLKEITQAKDSVRMFQVKVLNTGDKVIEPKIYLVYSNLETAQEIKAKPVRSALLPGNVKVLKLASPKNIPPGKYSLAAILDYGNNSSLEAVQMNIEVK